MSRSDYIGVYFDAKNNIWKAQRSFNGKSVCAGVFPPQQEKEAAKASDELVFSHLENGGKLSGRTKLNFRDDRVQEQDKTTVELISIIDENTSEKSEYASNILLTKNIFHRKLLRYFLR